MKKASKKLSINPEKYNALLHQLHKYSLILFIVLVVGVYGFVVFKIQSLSSQEPSETDISSQVQAAKIPKIDQNVVLQLQSLQDNSVNVQKLFVEARTNPFQE